ncbi:dihydrolipoyl dehydrogenase family protein [Thermodesulfobacteriota bacterium]
MNSSYDLLVIGAGSGGYAPAMECAKEGRRVALVESGYFGGTCPVTGCNPKKVLVQAAEAVERTRMISNAALSGAVHIDWPRLIAFKRSFTDPIPKAREQSFKNAGVDTIHGRARFTGRNSVRVDDTEIQAEHIVISTGSKPRELRMDGANLVTTSDQFMETTSLPGRVTFMGAGYISMEFAHVAAVAGARVTVIGRGPRPLAGFDADLVDLLANGLRAAGITILDNTEVESITREADTLVVHCRADKSLDVETDMVVHGAGRVPNLDGLDLKRGSVEYGPKGVVVNEYLQSVTNPAVYACGDCADSGLPLSPVAEMESVIVAHNLKNGNTLTADYTATPYVVFTNPPLAGVGMTTETVKASGRAFDEKFEDTSESVSSRRIGNRIAGYKVLTERDTGLILGAHIIGPHAEEVINVFALAMRYGLKAGQLKRSIWAFPTSCSAVEEMV